MCFAVLTCVNSRLDLEALKEALHVQSRRATRSHAYRTKEGATRGTPKEGIHCFHNKQIWLQASGARGSIIDHPGYYESLKNSFVEYPNPSYSQIDLDLKRTFPEDEMFKQEHVINTLRNVLVSYTRRNPSVGYCQGLNFVAGRLLKYLSEEVLSVFQNIFNRCCYCPNRKHSGCLRT